MRVLACKWGSQTLCGMSFWGLLPQRSSEWTFWESILSALLTERLTNWSRPGCSDMSLPDLYTPRHPLASEAMYNEVSGLKDLK